MLKTVISLIYRYFRAYIMESRYEIFALPAGRDIVSVKEAGARSRPCRPFGGRVVRSRMLTRRQSGCGLVACSGLVPAMVGSRET